MASNHYTTFTEQLYQSGKETKELPVPPDFAQEHSKKLIAAIKNEIEKHDGAISFRRYMEMVLYEPGLGYYAAGSEKLGEQGDFVTAPEISPLFSHALANAIMPALDKDAVILEVGAGRGRMAADILVYLQQQNKLPDEYWILELSADLRERQQKTIREALPEFIEKVKWLDSLPAQFSGVVLANELLDAMPVQLFHKNQNDLNEVNVGWHDDKFAFQLTSSFDQRLVNRVNDIEKELGQEFTSGYISEVNFAAEDWIKSIAEKIDSGIVVLIDYGFPRNEYYHEQRNQGTLMCHYQHRSHPDPLVYPGLQDITAHVDFTAMADAALESGMRVMGYTNQASFLIGAGLMEMLSVTNDNEKLMDEMEVASQVKKLTLPHEMGELFKVIGFSKNCDAALPAFSFRDLREYL